jgi:hypothetical protein
MTPLQAAKAHCANYQPDGSCLGIYYNDDLSIDWKRHNPLPRCLLAKGKRCAYFEEVILPMRLARPHEAEALAKAVNGYRRVHKLQGQRFCQQCGEAPLLAKQRVCTSCRAKRRREAYRKYNLLRKRSNGVLTTTVKPISAREKNPVLSEIGSGQHPPDFSSLNCGKKRSDAQRFRARVGIAEDTSEPGGSIKNTAGTRVAS